MKRNRLLAILTSAVMASAFAVPVEVQAAEMTENAAFSYDSCTFEEFLTYDAEEICGISEQAKTVYEESLAELADLTFDDSFAVKLSDEYEASVPYYTDPVTAREMIGDELKLDTSIYWGIVTPIIGDNTSPSVSVYLHPEEKLSLTEKYGLENNEFAAKTAVWISLSSNVEAVSPRYMSPHPTGVDADTNYYTYEFDDIVNMDMKEIFDLVLHTPLIYVDALAYARENGFDQYTDLTDYSFIIKSGNLDNLYDPDNMTNAFKQLHIDAQWLKDGSVISRGDKQYQLIISDAFVNEHLNYGYDYDNITLFASMYFWLSAGTHVDDFSVEVNDEPDVSEIYTFNQFLELSEEEVVALAGEAKPMFEPQSYCDYVKAEALKTLENDALEMSVYVSLPLLYELFYLGSDSGAEYLVSECGLPEALVTEAEKGYTTYEWDGAVYHEVKVKFSVDEVLAYPYEPEDIIYRIAAWLRCDDRIINVRMINTDYISIGLTESEVYDKYTFEEFMTLSTEEICGITEELKEMYEETVNAARTLGFNKKYTVDFTREYQNTVDVPYFDDPVAARRMIREELRIPDELYWGIISQPYDDTDYPYIKIYISDENLEEFTARYNCDEAEVAARLLVWLNLNPNVTRAGGGYTPEGFAGGVKPWYMYEDMGFEEVMGKDIQQIFHLPYDASLYYVDALEIVQEMGIDDTADLCGYTYKLQMYPFADYYTDGVFTNYTELFETLYITEDWLSEGTVGGPYADAENEERIWFDVNLNEDFYYSCLSKGWSNEDIMATIYMWFAYNGAVYDISVEPNEAYTPPAVTHGEITHDGKISLLDIVSLSKYNAGIVNYNSSQLKAADCTGDGIVDGDDLTALLMFIVNLIDTLPADIR